MAANKEAPPSQYFTTLARSYASQTGNSTHAMFASSLDLIIPPIVSSSVIHDNAGGVGTATSVIFEKLAATFHDGIPEVLITDNNPAMIAAARDAFRDHSSRITAAEMDSQDLSNVPDNKFTHSILNFSVFLFPDALAALREIHRTLQPSGVAALLTWKRFGFSSVIHAAQRLVRPDLPLLPLPGAQFMNDGVLHRHVIESGFDESNIQVAQKETVRVGEDVEGMKALMVTTFLQMACKGWSDEDKKKWPTAIEQAISSEVEEYGGVKFEAWVVIAKK